MKIIKIAGNNFKMTSSAYTQFAYRNLTNRSFLSDIQKLVELQKKEDFKIEDLDQVIDLILEIAYVMINEADKTQANTYEDFLKSLKEPLFDDKDWIMEVITLACLPLSGQLQNVK